MRKTVLVFLDIPLEYFHRAEYVCDFLSDAWGLRVETTIDLSRRDKSQIVYSVREQDLRVNDQVIIPFDALLYAPETPCCAATLEGHPIWIRKGAMPVTADLLASTFRLLTLADEQQISSGNRDAYGNFLVSALPQGRRETVDVPLADHQASVIKDWLFRVAPTLCGEVLPRWPDGKKFTVCLSHDTDAVHLGHPRELATTAAKWLVRRQRVYYDMFVAGWKTRKTPLINPFWGFPGWREFEEPRNIRSCFYLSVPPRKCRRRLNDCKSDMFTPGVDWAILRAMHAQGWEFGLHPVLNAKDDVEELKLEKQAVEKRLGASISGLRHHYLAIDNLHPARTFRSHVAAGFSYDSSIGWQERAGFRAGTCLPWQPYDLETDQSLPLVELPLCLMDGYVMADDVPTAVRNALAIVSAVRQAGGVATINWHTETYCSQYVFKNYRPVLEQLLASLLADCDAWFATPLEIANWWHKRSEALGNKKD